MTTKKPIKKTSANKKEEPAKNIVRKSIQKLYSKTAPLLMFESVLFLFAAVLFFVHPLQILAALTVVMGAVLALFGLYQIFIGLFSSSEENPSKAFNAVFGIVDIIIGIVFFLQPAGSMIAIMYVFAALFLFRSIQYLILSIRMWQANFGHYVINTLLSLAMIVMAVLIFFFPGLGAVTAMYYVGVILVFYALSNLFMYRELFKLRKHITE